MDRHATPFVAAVLALMLGASAASAAALRVPQIPVNGTSLQTYLNGVGESINVPTDQADAQEWASTVSGNSTFTMMIELAGYAASNKVGVYNGDAVSPSLFQVFPGAADAGWFAIASFKPGNKLIVNLFDATATLQSTTTYLGVNSQDFGFYLKGPGGTFYTQDVRNGGGLAQAITFAATGGNAGSWWLAFEDLPRSGVSDADFNDAVLFLESINPTPVGTTTWGGLKSRYR